MKSASKEAIRQAKTEMKIMKSVICKRGGKVAQACKELGYKEKKEPGTDWQYVRFVEGGE